MSAANALDSLMSGANLALEQAQSKLPQAKVSREQIHKTAQEFEASFLSQMFQHMFEGVGNDQVFGGGAGEDSFKSFMIGEYAKMTAKTGRVGLAQQIEAQMLKLQEVTP
ncbi:Chemotactic signal-response protein CheL [Rhodospirillaceae bacterium LM-1]|nr:Chemotactic signal-response protein CheL [Rhodospirillaceae bacterium LM-1]